MLRHALLALALAFSLATYAEAAPVEDLPWVVEDDLEVRELPLGGGVFLRQERRDGQINAIEVDKSSQPPVMCLHRQFSDFKWAFEFCKRSDSPWYDEVSLGVARMEAFIIKNGIHGETAESLAALTADYARNNAGAATKSLAEQAEICRRTVDVGLIRTFNEMGRDKFRAEIDAWLSIPRPPAMEPLCF